MATDPYSSGVHRAGPGTRATVPARPGPVSRILHWVLAVLIVFQGLWGAAARHLHTLSQHLQTALAVHSEVGLVILALTLWLLSLRFVEGRRSGQGLSGVHARLAGLVHAVLYIIIVSQVLLGIVFMGLLGMGLSVGPWNLALPMHPDPGLAFHQVLHLHALIALILALLVIGHSAAALYHHFVLRDDVLRRMLPRGHGPGSVESESSIADGDLP